METVHSSAEIYLDLGLQYPVCNKLATCREGTSGYGDSPENIKHTWQYNPSNIFARARLVYTRHMTEYSPAETGGYPRLLKTGSLLMQFSRVFIGLAIMGYEPF